MRLFGFAFDVAWFDDVFVALKFGFTWVLVAVDWFVLILALRLFGIALFMVV